MIRYVYDFELFDQRNPMLQWGEIVVEFCGGFMEPGGERSLQSWASDIGRGQWHSTIYATFLWNEILEINLGEISGEKLS